MVSDRNNQSEPVSIQLQRKDLKEKMAALTVEYQVCADKALTTSDPSIQVKLEAQKKNFLSQIQATEDQLRDLEQQSNDINRQTLSFDEALPKIDFRRARQIIRQVIATLDLDDGGAALMLLQQSREMAGDLLLTALDDVLNSGTISPIRYPITFTPSAGGADATTFLKLLGGYLGIESTGDQNADVITICQTLCGSLRKNSTVVIHLTNWDVVGSANQHELMRWLIDGFWKPLVNQLSEVLENWYVRVIFVIVANRKLTPECQQIECFCTVDNFDGCSILELPLECWTERDIATWLRDHFQIPKHQRDDWAKHIHADSEGKPYLTRTALQEYFEQLLASQINSME